MASDPSPPRPRIDPLHPAELGIQQKERLLSKEDGLAYEQRRDLGVVISPRHFTAELAATRSPKAVQELIREHNLLSESIDLTNRSGLIFKQLLWLGTEFEEMIRFLCDPQINLPAAGNIGRIMRYHQTRIKTVRDYHSLVLFVESAVEHGLVTNSGLKDILRRMPHLTRKVFREERAIKLNSCLFLHSIWRAIKCSSGFSPKDVDTNNWNTILCQVAGLDFTTETRLLFAEFIKSLRPSQLWTLSHRVSTVFAAGMMRLVAPKGANELVQADLGSVGWLIDILLCLPPRYARRIVRCTTTVLHAESQARGFPYIPTRVLYPWMATVGQCGCLLDIRSARRGEVFTGRERRALEDALGLPWNFARMEPYLASRNRRGLSELLMRYWIRHQLAKDGGVANNAFASVTADFQARVLLHPGEELFYNIIYALRRNKQAYMVILCRLCRLLRRLEKPLEVYWLCKSVIRYHGTIDPHIMRIELYELARVDIQAALRLYKLQLRNGPATLYLNNCRDFVGIVINSPTINPVHLLNLLGQPVQARYIGRRNSQRDLLKSEARMRWVSLRNVKMSLKLRIDLARYMATQFAQAGHLSHRAAFRYVHRCYKVLCLCRGDLHTDVVRAMVHAGITRPLQAGHRISTVKLRYILEIVRQAEGKDVARTVDELVYQWGCLNILRKQNRNKILAL